MDECLCGTTGGGAFGFNVTPLLGIGCAKRICTDVCDAIRCGGNGGADESNGSIEMFVKDISILLMLLELPTFCIRFVPFDPNDSFNDVFKAVVDLACAKLDKFDPCRLGTGGGGGLFGGRDATKMNK